MKNIIFIFLLFSNIVKSQTTTIDITASEAGLTGDYYLKDFNNILNQFEGTYIYNYNNSTFKIDLKKIINQPVNTHHEDMIIGEYQFIKNDIEIVNTLNTINTNYADQYLKHSIASMYVIDNINNRLWKCPQCDPNEKRLALRIIDKSTNRYARMLIRKTVLNGQQVLQVKIYNVSTVAYNVETESAPANFSLPLGEFTMIKQ